MMAVLRSALVVASMALGACAPVKLGAMTYDMSTVAPTAVAQAGLTASVPASAREIMVLVKTATPGQTAIGQGFDFQAISLTHPIRDVNSSVPVEDIVYQTFAAVLANEGYRSEKVSSEAGSPGLILEVQRFWMDHENTVGREDRTGYLTLAVIVGTGDTGYQRLITKTRTASFGTSSLITDVFGGNRGLVGGIETNKKELAGSQKLFADLLTDAVNDFREDARAIAALRTAAR